jgi:polysaccharide biosynthesis transport protein
MNPLLSGAFQPRELIRILRQHLWLWVAPTVAFGLLAAAYVLVRPARWEAEQSLVVRDERGGNLSRQGRFDNPDAMKSALETVQEIARSRSVVAAALREIGPPPGARQPEQWPAPADIESAQASIAVQAPKGAEFGKTEVVRLITNANTRQRAIDFNQAVCQQLDLRLRELREAKAQSMIDEQTKAVDLARADLDRATRKLQAMERQVGPDLGELRTLNDKGAGESNLRSSLNQIKNELRQARATIEANEQLLRHLHDARSNPEGLVATPNRLLESQPALRRLKDGLVDAQLRTADTLSKLNEQHPLAQAAIAAEDQVRRDLHAELAGAIQGVSSELEVVRAQTAALEAQLADVTGRLDRLAGLRAGYANLADEVQQRSQVLERANQDLADARASLAAARSVSLITPVDGPETPDRPSGPGRTSIVLAAATGGLMAGLGLVFLATPMGSNLGRRRWNDCVNMGRRAGDMLRRRRSTDTPDSTPPAGGPGRETANELLVPVRRRADDRPAPSPEPACPQAGLSSAVNPDRRTGHDRRG